MQSQTSTIVPAPRPRLHRTNWLREILDTLMLVIVIYTLVNLSSARYMVQGKSMYPNFDDNQILYISRLNYLLGEPEHLDIVVFHFPGNPQEDYIKRIIGLPGDVVEIRAAQVYVNGQPLQEPYIHEPCEPGRCQDQHWELGPNEFFVMGDNRNHSSDSRVFGLVTRDHLVGEVLVRYWPPESWGIVTKIGAPALAP
ncbi:MAG: signal peptidase I [Anaerolineae bacterium]|nr:signal peptidase I [Anaerolineae bacterium]